MHGIRAERPEDFGAIWKVEAAAFERAGEADLVDALRHEPEFIPELSLVAEQAGQIVGHVLFSPAPIVGKQHTWPALALAPVAVLPEWHNRGIGSALIRHGLHEARQLGHRIVVVLGHAKYYPRFGFGPARPVGIEAPFPVNDASFMAMALVPGGLDGVAGTIRYAAPFSLLD